MTDMTDKKQKAAGYIRVSSIGQIDNESLSTQRAKIKKYCEANEYKLTEIYADEGISGGSVDERHELLQALHDARKNKFDILIVNDLSRFGRNARELLNNHDELEQYGIKLRSIKEGINFDTPIGKAMLTMLAAIAELELTMIKERMMEGTISKALRGIPPANHLPFGRTFDEKNMKWGIEENKKRAMEWVYDEYVEKDRSLQQIATEIESRFDFPISYDYLLTVLEDRCGTEWEVNYQALDEPKKFTPPRLLSDDKIQAIKDRRAHNRTNNRTDAKDYLLSGFVRCMNPDCHKTLSAQTQRTKYGDYVYLVHPHKTGETCREFTTIPLKKVEKEVFEMIFDSIGDMAGFEEDIKDSLPDETYIEELKQDIKRKKERLDEVKKEWNKIKRLLRKGIYKEGEVLDDINELREIRERLTDEIDEAKDQLEQSPDPEEVKKEGHRIRKELLEKYESIDRLNEMTFAEKKRLLHFLFDGKAPKGKGYGGHDKYGIYIDKKGKGKNAEYYYLLFGRLRAFKHKDFDDKGGRTRLFDVQDKDNSTHKKSHYKTKNFQRDRK